MISRTELAGHFSKINMSLFQRGFSIVLPHILTG